MNVDTDLFFLEQVYNFLAERPEFKSKKSKQQLIDFLEAIHDDSVRGILFIASDKIVIRFGKRREINILTAPTFKNKDDFLKWISGQLRS